MNKLDGIHNRVEGHEVRGRPCHSISGTVGSFIVAVSSQGRELQNG